MTDSQKEVGAQFNENTAAKTNNFSDGGSKKRYYVEGALCGLAIATVILFCYIMITRRKRHTRTTRETVDLTENHTSESGSDNDFRILKHANLHNLNSLKPITPLKVEKTRDTHCVRLLRFIEQARNTPKTMTLVKAVENTTVPGNASHQPSCDNGLGHDSDVPERDELSSGSQSSIEYSENGGDAESSMYYESHGDDNSDFELDIVWDPDDDEVDAADLEQGESFEGSVRSSNGSAGSSLSSMSGSDFDNKGTSQKFMEPLHKSHFMPSAETASAPTVVLENQGHPCQEIRCAD